jgi:hypothetical protein
METGRPQVFWEKLSLMWVLPISNCQISENGGKASLILLPVPAPVHYFIFQIMRIDFTMLFFDFC